MVSQTALLFVVALVKTPSTRIGSGALTTDERGTHRPVRSGTAAARRRRRRGTVSGAALSGAPFCLERGHAGAGRQPPRRHWRPSAFPGARRMSGLAAVASAKYREAPAALGR